MLAGLSTAAAAPFVGGAAPAAAQAGLPIEAVTPERWGARGDGVGDDALAIQRALDALAARGVPGVLILQPRVAYRCDSGLVINSSLVTILGWGLLDFARCSGPCLRVTASSTARPGTPAQNFGHRGMISGALRIVGGGLGRTSTGVLFDSDIVGTAAQLLVENLSVSRCDVGVMFGRRAYNNVLIRCDLFDCGQCVLWPTADDNGERNTLIGCTLYNSDTGVRIEQPSGACYLNNCSIDYTRTLYDVARGMVFATDCHHESDRWESAPLQAAGDGSVIRLLGGVVVGQADPLPADVFIRSGEGSSVRLDGVFLHNVILSGPAPASWAIGGGEVQLENSEGFGQGRVPVRLHRTRTALADPDFTAPDWQDPVWRLANGGVPITGRYGEGDDPLVLRRARADGAGALSVVRRDDGNPARFVLLSQHVRPGDRLLVGFQVRGAAGRPVLVAEPSWARIDGQDATGVPNVTRLDPLGAVTVTPPRDRYATVVPLGPQASRPAPAWATHFLMVVDVTRPDGQALFRGLWSDLI